MLLQPRELDVVLIIGVDDETDRVVIGVDEARFKLIRTRLTRAGPDTINEKDPVTPVLYVVKMTMYARPA